MPKYLKIRNFERYQHYKDRRPPWIKLYRDLWNEPRFFELSESDRYFLISFFVIASQNDNRIPANDNWLKREMATRRAIPIAILVTAGWLEWEEQDASTVLATSVHDDSITLVLPRERDRERNTETERETPKPPLQVFGEFGWVRLTSEQHQNLKIQLNGRTDDYIARFDGWVQEAPEAKAHGVRRKDRDAYASILNWHRKDVAEGKHGKHHESEGERIAKAAANAAKRFNG